MPDPIEIIRTDHGSHGTYRAEVPGAAHLAELTWRSMGDARIANHTFVPPEIRGQGIAQKLVEALVADARALGFTIVPECSYVDALFRRHPEWSDLRAER